jgi:predicted methyltransferase
MKITHFVSSLCLVLMLACGAPGPSMEGTTPAAASEETAPPSTEVAETAAPIAPVDPNNPYQVIVAAADRSADDRKIDDGRHPAELLAFIGVQPGMRVADLAAGGGYTTELLARAVGPTGRVYGQNSPWLLQRFAEGPWTARLQTPAMQNVTRLDREFDAPFPDDVRDLDAVVDVLFYHDTYWLNVDRDKMNQAIFTALKPGGMYIVVDHSGRDGTLSTEVKTLHRIEEKLVRTEILRAGFTLAEEGTFLRNPNDPRDWNASPGAAGVQRGTSDRFALKFVKP